MDRLYRAMNHAWVGEHWVGRFPINATDYAELPPADDPRWIKGTPTVLDTEVLTLSPFYPSRRLGVCVEKKESQPFSRHPNHPPFQGAVAWMPLDVIAWDKVPSAT
jgi:hypothetical protein